MTVLSILLASSFAYISSGVTVFSDNIVDITPVTQGVYICDCDVVQCNVEALGQNGKDIALYTYATTSSLVCGDPQSSLKDSCQGAKVYVNPDPADLPISLNLTGKNCNPIKVDIDCRVESGCKDMEIYSLDVDIDISALEKSSFDEGRLICNDTDLQPNPPKCDVECGVEACEQITLCDDFCECNNGQNSPNCPGYVAPVPGNVLPGGLLIPVNSCEGKTVFGVCTLRPQRDDLVVVPKGVGVDILIIICKQNERCKGTTIISGVNDTRIECGFDPFAAGTFPGNAVPSYQACDSLTVKIGEINETDIPHGYTRDNFKGPFNSVVIEARGKDSLKDANITFAGKFAERASVIAIGDKSFSESGLYCDEFCDLQCNDLADEPCDQAMCELPCVQTNLTSYSDPRPNFFRVDKVLRKGKPPKKFVGKKGALVVFTNADDECLLDCSQYDQCGMQGNKRLAVFSGCNSTTIRCGEQGCKKGLINVGALTSLIPQGYTADDFKGSKKTFILECFDYQSCYQTKINVIGEFTVEVYISGMMPNALKDAQINCEAGGCIVKCDNDNACDKLLLSCPADKRCLCDGGSCVLLDRRSTNVDVLTPAPTQPSPAPTANPSNQPSKQPSFAPTSSDLIVYTPDQSGIFICKKNVNVCVLDCNNGMSQCDQRTILLSAANKTIILCDEADACKMTQFLFGKSITQTFLMRNFLSSRLKVSDFRRVTPAYSVSINCTGKGACYKSQISADFRLTKFDLYTGDANDALKDASITIKSRANADSECNIECGVFGCKDARFVDVSTCDCTGVSCPPTVLLKQSNVNANIPNAINEAALEKHYPTFLPTAIIVCISLGLISLIGFCVYYKYFSKNSMNLNLLGDSVNNFDTFNTNTKSLEMENYI